MYDCITIGDIKLDTFVVLHDASIQCHLRMPECQLCIEYGGKIPVEAIDAQIAGSAPNVAVGLRRLGLHTAVFSVMGKDSTRKVAFERMAEERVDTRYIKVEPKARSSFAVVINYRGEKTILASHEPYTYRLPKLAPTRWIYVCELGIGYLPLYHKLLRAIGADSIHLAMNPGAIQIKERKPVLYDLMKKTSLLFLNVGEARALTRSAGTAKVEHVVSRAWRLNRKIAIVTAGRGGAYAFDGERMLFLAPFPGKRIEATGAGDAFATGVIAASAKGLKLTEALRWGAVNAASVVSMIGPQAGLVRVTEMQRRLRTHPGFRVKRL